MSILNIQFHSPLKANENIKRASTLNNEIKAIIKLLAYSPLGVNKNIKRASTLNSEIAAIDNKVIRLRNSLLYQFII